MNHKSRIGLVSGMASFNSALVISTLNSSIALSKAHNKSRTTSTHAESTRAHTHTMFTAKLRFVLGLMLFVLGSWKRAN